MCVLTLHCHGVMSISQFHIPHIYLHRGVRWIAKEPQLTSGQITSVKIYGLGGLLLSGTRKPWPACQLLSGVLPIRGWGEMRTGNILAIYYTVFVSSCKCSKGKCFCASVSRCLRCSQASMYVWTFVMCYGSFLSTDSIPYLWWSSINPTFKVCHSISSV